jgi:hypothetical protein
MGKKTEMLRWVCPLCGSIHVQAKTWVNVNDSTIDWDGETDDYYCLDCEENLQSLDQRTIKCVNGAVKVQGYQVVNDENEIHPHMDASFCIYNLQQAYDMLLSKVEGDWKLLTIYKGDVEEPTMMFGGDPRKFIQR